MNLAKEEKSFARTKQCSQAVHGHSREIANPTREPMVNKNDPQARNSVCYKRGRKLLAEAEGTMPGHKSRRPKVKKRKVKLRRSPAP